MTERAAERVAGAVIFKAGDRAAYLYGATSAAALELRAGYLLHFHIIGWLLGTGAGCRNSRLVTTVANGSPAFGQYKPDPAGGFGPWALVVLGIDQGRIAELAYFLDTDRLFPMFGLPPRLDPDPKPAG